MKRSDIALKYFEQQSPETKQRITDGIEQNRKGEAVIRFVSEKPLPADIVLEVEQRDHEFRFGANLFMLDEFETPEKNRQYRAMFPELFNLATLPFYWDSLEPQPGVTRYAKDAPRIYRRPSPDLCLAYCREQGIEPKAHCLNYDFFRPRWLWGATVEEHKAALEKHFAELAERYAAQIPSWEVTNETFNVTFAKAFLDEHYSQFYREREFNEWSFLTADRYFPHNRLIINDHLDFGCMRSPHGEYFGQRSPYYMEIERMMAHGVSHLDTIGFQYHCFFPREMEQELNVTRYNPVHLLDILDTYQTLGKRLQITEMTVSAFGDSREDEEIQAQLLSHLYTLFFSHPAMDAIIYWNLPDGYAAGGKPGEMEHGENRYRGGLCRFDLSEKPAYRALKNLIRDEWHTSLTVRAENGVARFKGFFGNYRLKVIAGGKEIPVDFTLASGIDNELILRL